MKNLSVLEIVEKIKNKEISCEVLTQYYLNNIIKYKHKNAVLEVFDDALSRAREIDKMVASGVELPALVGVPMLIKDNIMYKGKICSSASKILEHYKAEYSATVVEKLLKAGVVILGRTNMDEFAMGGSCENSAFGPCRNAHDDTRVSGGSSGGSAVATALDMCAFALGSDTGGSVRQPASYNGVYGIKPTNSRVSRYGLMAFAGTLDTIGIFTRNAKDNAYILSIIAGSDDKDITSSKEPVDDYLSSVLGDIKGKKIAIVKEVQELVAKTEHADLFQKILSFCQENGAIINEVHVKHYTSILPVYYTIAMAEASSNMNRFDGVRFTSKIGGDKYFDSVKQTRSELLGKEVKRRIMIGNFVLSSEHYSSYYLKAKRLASQLRKEFLNILKDNDLIFMPTTYGEAFTIGSKVSDPVSMYIEDIFTVTANILGVPAMSVPIAKGSTGLPLGLQIISCPFGEKEIYNMADFLSRFGGEA
jgi:aspartyl-tRNA(Asn)/glutamyl-tRNA(Gln) amidotransferase subunit A